MKNSVLEIMFWKFDLEILFLEIDYLGNRNYYYYWGHSIKNDNHYYY